MIVLAVTSAIRIGGALFLGTLIILVAFFVQKDTYAVTPQGAVVQKAPERTALETRDSDGDGTPDWEENLTEIFVDSAVLASSSLLAQPTELYEPPTTFTGKFSEAFFKDYLDGKMNGEDYTDPTAFIGTAVQAIEQNTQSKRYTRLDFIVVPTTDVGMHTYGNRVGEINITHAQTSGSEDATEILYQALENKDPQILEKLEPLRTGYSNIITDLLAMEVPDELADKHVAILNAYEAMLTNTEAMRIAFNDPLFALARVKTYKSDALALFTAFKDVNLIFREKNIQFTTDELGTFFYLFDS